MPLPGLSPSLAAHYNSLLANFLLPPLPSSPLLSPLSSRPPSPAPTLPSPPPDPPSLWDAVPKLLPFLFSESVNFSVDGSVPSTYPVHLIDSPHIVPGAYCVMPVALLLWRNDRWSPFRFNGDEATPLLNVPFPAGVSHLYFTLIS